MERRENLRKRKNFSIINSIQKVHKIISKPSYKKNHICISENFVISTEKQNKIYYNKPLYVGTTILDYAKFIMYDFYYNVLKSFYNDKITLIYTDTDSFILEIYTDDLYQDILNNFLDYFDLSSYDDNHPIFYNKSKEEIKLLKLKNQGVLGKYKDELGGNIMNEFYGLRAKSYYYESWDPIKKESLNPKKKNKGVKNLVIENEIDGNDYKKCLSENKKKIIKQNLIQSYNHNLHTIVQEKIALSNDDDKRFILDDGISTLAYGHFRIKENDN
jgi:hypothetical protein